MTTTTTEPTVEAGTYTVRELAEVLRCTPNAIYKRVDKGEIPDWVIRRFGRRIEFGRAAVTRWLAGEGA